jgi:hypothetical protein
VIWRSGKKVIQGGAGKGRGPANRTEAPRSCLTQGTRLVRAWSLCLDEQTGHLFLRASRGLCLSVRGRCCIRADQAVKEAKGTSG